MRGMRLPLLTCLVSASVAFAGPLSLTDGFEPHPFSQRVQLPNGNVSMLDTPWKKCGTSDTTREPAFVFTLPAAMSDLELLVDAPGVLIGPDGGFVCLRGNPIRFASWPAGTWKVQLISSTLTLGANITLSQPTRVQQAAEAAKAKKAEAQAAKDALEQAFREARFGEAPRIDLGKLTEPVVFDVTTSDAARGPSGLGLCQGLPLRPSFFLTGRARDVEVFVWRGPRKLEVQLAGPLEQVRVAGQKSDDDDDEGGAVDVHFTCEEDFPWHAERLKGTVAFFLTGKKPSEPVTLVAWDRSRRVDPTWAPRPLPESVPLGPQRALSVHYPLADAEARHTDLSGNWLPQQVEGFFRTAPRTLFVSVGKDAEANADGKPVKLTPGEPLLVRSWGKEEVSLNRLDGTYVTVERQDVVELPSPAVLPTNLTAAPAIKTVDDALYYATDNEKAFVERYTKLESELNGCVGAWMEKNDPTWGKSYDLVFSNGQTMSERKFKQADAVCGWPKVEAAGKKLVGEVSGSLKKNLAAYRKALVARFAK